MKEEIWKDIEGYEGLYQVSNLGRVKRMRFINKNTNIEKERIKSQKIRKDGYLEVALYKNGKGKYIQVHRLVAKSFIPNPKKLPQVNHIDGNKENNCVDNLEWVTNKENVTHAIKTGLQNNSGEHNGKAKLTQQQAEEIRKIRKEKNVPYRQIAKKYNVSHYTIIQICKNRYYK